MSEKQKFKSGITFFLLFLISQAFATESKSNKETDWFLAKKSNDISLYYRWIELENGLEIREMKAEFTIDAEISKIISQFSNTENYLKWAVGITKCGIEKHNDSLWYTHSVMNYPWPFKNKDLVTKHYVVEGENSTNLLIESVPGYMEQMKGIERMENYQGTWNFVKVDEGITNVNYRIVSFEKPVFPRFVQDPVIQKISINSFTELKHLAEAQ